MAQTDGVNRVVPRPHYAVDVLGGAVAPEHEVQNERAFGDVDIVLLGVSVHRLGDSQQHVIAPSDIGIDADTLGVGDQICVGGEPHARRSA